MASIANMTISRDRLEAPVWVTVDTEDGPFEIETRGFTRAYRDGLAAARRRLVQDRNRRLPPGQPPITDQDLAVSEQDGLMGAALADHCVTGVRGLTHADGSDLTIDELRRMLRDPAECPVLLGYVIQAVGWAHEQARQRADEAAGN